MRTQNYVNPIPQSLKIAAIAFVALYVDTNIDTWFNFAFILGVPCAVCGNKQEMAMLQHDLRISFFLLILVAEIPGFVSESIFH
jgi:hypothetical protein